MDAVPIVYSAARAYGESKNKSLWLFLWPLLHSPLNMSNNVVGNTNTIWDCLLHISRNKSWIKDKHVTKLIILWPAKEPGFHSTPVESRWTNCFFFSFVFLVKTCIRHCIWNSCKILTDIALSWHDIGDLTSPSPASDYPLKTYPREFFQILKFFFHWFIILYKILILQIYFNIIFLAYGENHPHSPYAKRVYWSKVIKLPLSDIPSSEAMMTYNCHVQTEPQTFGTVLCKSMFTGLLYLVNNTRLLFHILRNLYPAMSQASIFQIV